jgi:hypothetical protein
LLSLICLFEPRERLADESDVIVEGGDICDERNREKERSRRRGEAKEEGGREEER